MSSPFKKKLLISGDSEYLIIGLSILWWDLEIHGKIKKSKNKIKCKGITFIEYLLCLKIILSI